MFSAVYSRIPGLGGITVLLASWQYASITKLVNPVLLPPPTTVAAVLWEILSSGTALLPLAKTLALLAAGYAIACGLGIAFGIAMGRSRFAYGLLEPLVELLRPIPKPALVPPLFLFLGIGVKTMIVIVALTAFFPVLISTLQGVKGIDRTLIDTARTFHCSTRRVLFQVVFPAALPMIVTGMRVSLGLALALTILAEMLAGESGVGYAILDAQRSFRLPEMYAWIVLLAAIGVALNSVFEWAEERTLPWRGL